MIVIFLVMQKMLRINVISQNETTYSEGGGGVKSAVMHWSASRKTNPVFVILWYWSHVLYIVSL